MKMRKGGLNRLIDGVFHPHFDEQPAFIFLDGLLHAVAEQNPSESLGKFIKYNLPKLLRQNARRREQR